MSQSGYTFREIAALYFEKVRNCQENRTQIYLKSIFDLNLAN